MRWLLLVLLISVAGLLVAALAAARFIWQQRARRVQKPSPIAAKASVQNEETDVETEL
jgi:hypothetical protein